MRLSIPVLAPTLAALLQISCSHADASKALAGRKLEPSIPVTGVLDLTRTFYLDFRVVAPADAVCVRWKLVVQGVDLDLATRRGEAVDGENGLHDFLLTTDTGVAQIVYDRFTAPEVGSGAFHARIEWPFAHRPRTPGGSVKRIPYLIQADVIRARVDGELGTQAPIHGRVTAPSGGFRTYTVTVPPDTSVLRLDLADATGDLDLLARLGGPALVLDDSVRSAQHLYGRETLILENPDGSALSPGTWYVDVVDPYRDERPTLFELRARFDHTPPADLLVYPAFAGQLGPEPLGRALAAVVELSIDDSNGSGTILTPDGWILTAAHVVTDIGGETAPEVVVSLTLDSKLPAREMFRARVHDVDLEQDLALLKITRGFFGQDLPQQMTLPTVSLDFASEAPAIGDVLYLVGYPSTGGQGQRVSVSATKGIVAGFETMDFGVILKTDAEITGGNSGGAAVDARGRLIGVPTSTIENGAGQIGYVHPVGGMKAEWRALIASAPRAK